MYSAAATAAVPVAVTSTGFGWTPVLLTIANLLIGGVFVAIIRTRPALKKIANEREANLLTERAEEMESMRERMKALEAKIEAKDAQHEIDRIVHEAERAYDRHRINNLDQCVTSFLMMVRANPTDGAKAATMIEELRTRQVEEEKRENIALRDLRAKLVTGKPAEA